MEISEPNLLGEIITFLMPHFRTEEERDAVLLPVVGAWNGRTSITYGGSAGSFTARLVDVLPAELLTAVLRKVPTGAEKEEQVESLCRRILAAAGVPALKDPLTLLQRTTSPARPDDGQSPVLFRPLGPRSASGQAAEAHPVNSFRGNLTRQQPLLLVTDFAADVPEVLSALSADDRNPVWLGGQKLLHPAGAPHPGSESLSKLPPSLLLIDCSAVQPEHLLTPESEPTTEPTPTALVEAILDWAAGRRHRVVLALPRFALARLDLETLRRRPLHMIESADLFSARYRFRPEACEQKLRRKLPFRKVLFPLLSANSAALPRVAERLVRELRIRPGLEDRALDAPEWITIALDIAAGFMKEGFHEIAYRLEGYCRTVSGQRGLVPLAADVLPNPTGVRDDEQIFGFLDSTADIPAAVRRGVLTASAGSGKTTSLLSVEHSWYVPRLDEPGAVTPSLPLYVSLDGDAPAGLAGQLTAHLRRNLPDGFDYGGERFTLPCHALLRKVGSLTTLRCLFSSPPYLLLDDVDGLSTAGLSRLCSDLHVLYEDDLAVGMLLACRDDRTVLPAALRRLKLRELSERQIRTLLSERDESALLGLLIVDGTCLSQRHMRNPRLLALLRELRLTRPELADANLRRILELYVSRQSERIVGRREQAILDDVLPRTALEFKTTGVRRRTTDDPGEQAAIAAARQAGLLKQCDAPGVLEFPFDQVRDYFAARALAEAIRTGGVEDTLHRYVGDPDDWQDVLRIAVTLLPPKGADRLLHWVEQRTSRAQAQEYAEELRRTSGRRQPLAAVASVSRNFVGVPRSGFLEAFRIGKYPVTNAEFAGFVRADGYETDRWWGAAGWEWRRKHEIRFPRYWLHGRLNLPDQPVTGVNLFEADAYCAWLSERHSGHFRLPSAAEWDSAAYGANPVHEAVLKAARRNGNGAGPADDGYEEGLVSAVKKYMDGYSAVSSGSGAPPSVGSFQPNRLGIHDLFGSVWQWCDSSLSVDDAEDQQVRHLPRGVRLGPGEAFVVKGGAATPAHDPVWSLIGGWFDPFVRFHQLGFRVRGTA
ncbi:SUMF1/EgtB/PvdO family nonheme iron enzyme [Streptomyces coerulescens]|uniref:SUMF1/EgtB/PvdO family nonheme iron enzyme n=1 Tax=Streptomyces coerulescens TaxID=29304 RepID=A0ABW0CXP8_STRCD